MAHFAEIDQSNKVVRVIVCGEDTGGQAFLLQLGGTWVQTSYNTSMGLHSLGGAPLRKNYAGIDYTYDAGRDAFVPPKPFPSWVLDEVTCCYTAPVAHPVEGGPYRWDEEILSWIV